MTIRSNKKLNKIWKNFIYRNGKNFHKTKGMQHTKKTLSEIVKEGKKRGPSEVREVEAWQEKKKI